MRLFRWKKKYEDTSTSGEDDFAQHHGRESASPQAEQAQSSETLSPDGALGPRIGTGLGGPLVTGSLTHNVPDAVGEIRSAADPEDDNARATSINKEREAEERDR
ncbi:MAG TPA: hypothetical protein VNF08_02680 [Acidimicrobiales bacterium]|nr:hypothetical protein [Acidimicrobiales bacterium]